MTLLFAQPPPRRLKVHEQAGFRMSPHRIRTTMEMMTMGFILLHHNGDIVLLQSINNWRHHLVIHTLIMRSHKKQMITHLTPTDIH